MKLIFIFLLLVCGLAYAEQNYILARGQSLKISVGAHERIHISNRNVVSARDQGKAILITGKKLGYTSVVTSSKIFRVTVVGVDVARNFESLREITKSMRGLNVSVQDAFPTLQGELLRFSDWRDLAQRAREEGIKFKFEAQVTPELREEAQGHFRRLLSKNELPPVRILLESGARAVIPSEFESRRSQFKLLLSPFGIEIEKDNSTVALAPMVEVEILVAEVQRNILRKIGIQWPMEQKFSVSASAGTISFDNLEFALQALEAKGAGRILASPKLLSRSGKEAEFLAGGEFPIPIRSRNHSDIIWKKHGVLLKIKPLVDLSGRMSIDLETEVSLVNTREGIEGLPNFKTNRIKSHFDLEGPRTIALSGLLKSVEGRDRRGLPILSDIPLIGALFSSREYIEERTELVFFVTPRLVPFDTPSAKIEMPVWGADD